MATQTPHPLPTTGHSKTWEHQTHRTDGIPKTQPKVIALARHIEIAIDRRRIQSRHRLAPLAQYNVTPRLAYRRIIWSPLIHYSKAHANSGAYSFPPAQKQSSRFSSLLQSPPTGRLDFLSRSDRHFGSADSSVGSLWHWHRRSGHSNLLPFMDLALDAYWVCQKMDGTEREAQDSCVGLRWLQGVRSIALWT